MAAVMLMTWLGGGAVALPAQVPEPAAATDGAPAEGFSGVEAQATAQLDLARERYKAGDAAGMVEATQAGLALIGDSAELPKLRGALWYWCAVGAELSGEYQTALARYEQALAIQRGADSPREVAATLNSLGNAHGFLGNRSAQLEALLKARDIFEEIGEAKGRAAAANSLGNYFSGVGQSAEALPYHEQSVALRRTLDNPAYLASGLINLGITLQELKRTAEAEPIYREALAIYRVEDDPIGLSGVLTNLGTLVADLGHIEDALAYYQEALRYDQATEYLYGQAILTRNIAAMYDELAQYEEALPWLEQAVPLAEGLGDPERIESVLKLRAKVREAMADFPGALADWKAVAEISTQIAEASREDALLELQTEFETAEKQRAIDRLQREAAEQELVLTQADAARRAAEQQQALERARRQTTLAVAVGIGLLTLVLAGLFRAARRSERRLQLQQTQLEQALAGLQAGHAELKRLYDQKSEWLGFAVHDLRSPLFAIDTCCAQVVEGVIESPLEGVNEIRGAANRMRVELDAWLEAEREAQSEVQVHPVAVEMGPMVTDVVGLNQGAARAKDIALSHRILAPVRVHADPWRWREVVDNLVSNAIKFSPRGATVQVESGGSANMGWVRVCDQGPGFSAEDRERMFGAFARLSAQPTAGESSTGLGLRLVRQLVDAHGGEIVVIDGPSCGSIITVSIPLAS